MNQERGLARCVDGIHDRHGLIKVNIARKWIALWVRPTLHAHWRAIDKCMKATGAHFCGASSSHRSCNRSARPHSAFLQLRTHSTRAIFIAVEDHYMRTLIRDTNSNRTSNPTRTKYSDTLPTQRSAFDPHAVRQCIHCSRRIRIAAMQSA